MSKEEKERRIIDLYYNQGKTFREIAKELRVSFSYIAFVIKKYEAEQGKKNDADNSMNKNQQPSSSSTEAYKLFSEGKTTIQVATMLNLPASKIIKLYREYWMLRGLNKLNTIYKETNGKIWIVLKLYKELIKKRHMSIEKVANVVEIAIHNLPYMETLYEQVKEQVEKMQRTIQRLTNNIRALEYKISLLDTTAFSSEQECRRKEQQIQELTAEKDKLEKLIANILNNDNEGYSKLTQIIKENIKAVLSDNKILISLSFAAVIQTLKADPQLVKLIQNISSANDGEQYKDNYNNITKYLESNKDRILYLAEKHYENLVEALRYNTIDAAASSSYNPTLSLPQSSSTFPKLSNQSDTYRIEESDIHYNNRGDIAE